MVIHHAFLRSITIIFLSACLAACGAFEASPNLSLAANDFEQTEILAGSAVQANGSEQLLVAIHLKNSNRTPVPNYVPEIAIVQGPGVQPSVCSTSDANGVSACLLKAVVAGTKLIRLTNAKIGLEKEIQFTAPAGIQRLASVSSSGTHIGTAAGSVVQISLQPVGGVKRTTAGGYSVTLSVQGVRQ